MSNMNYLLIKYDYKLSKHINTNFTKYEMDQILSSVFESSIDRTYCLDFFLSNNFLQKNDYMYYYLLSKTAPYSGYKNLHIITPRLIENDCKDIDFNKLNI